MKLLFNLLLSFIIATPLSAQVTVRVYPELKDYVQRQSVKSSVFIEKRSVKNLKSAGGNEYMIYSEINSPDLNKFIEKDAWFIRHNDSLFFNCSHLKSTEYALVLVKNEQYLFFIAGESRLKEHKKYMTYDNEDIVLAGVMFGVIGSSIASRNAPLPAYYYLLDLNTGKIQALDRDGIAEHLKAKPELRREYLAKASPMDATTVTDFMKRLLNK